MSLRSFRVDAVKGLLFASLISTPNWRATVLPRDDERHDEHTHPGDLLGIIGCM